MFQIDYRLGIFSLTFSLFATFSFSILSPLPESWISQIGANYGGWGQKYTTEKYGKYYNGAGGQKRPAIHGRLLPIITEDLVRVFAGDDEHGDDDYDEDNGDALHVYWLPITTFDLIKEQAWLIKSRC